MCSIQTKHRLHNTNRIIIVVLTILGLLMNGYQHSDIIFGTSVIIWLWLPECDQLEEMMLDKLSLDITIKTARTFKKDLALNNQKRFNKQTVM